MICVRIVIDKSVPPDRLYAQETMPRRIFTSIRGGLTLKQATDDSKISSRNSYGSAPLMSLTEMFEKNKNNPPLGKRSQNTPYLEQKPGNVRNVG